MAITEDQCQLRLTQARACRSIYNVRLSTIPAFSWISKSLLRLQWMIKVLLWSRDRWSIFILIGQKKESKLHSPSLPTNIHFLHCPRAQGSSPQVIWSTWPTAGEGRGGAVFSNFCLQRNHLEGLLKSRGLGSTPEFLDSVDPRTVRNFTFLASSQATWTVGFGLGTTAWKP